MTEAQSTAERRGQHTALQGSEYNGTSVAVGAQGLVVSVRRGTRSADLAIQQSRGE